MLLFFICLLIPLNSFCQTKIQKGSIINEEGEVLTGFIQYTSDTKFCHKVIFYSLDKTKKRIYIPKEIQGYTIKSLNRKFKRFLLPLASTAEKEDSVQQVVFVEILVETPSRSLYYYQSKSGKKRLFIQTAETGTKELISEEKSKKENGGTYQYVNKKYLGLLKVCFKDCKEIKNFDFSKLTLGILSISDFFLKHSECLNEKILHESSICSDRGDLQIAISLGLSYTSSVSTNPPFRYFTNHLIEPKPYIGTPFGVSFYYFPPFMNNTFFFGMNTYYSLKGSSSDSSRARFKQHYLNIGLVAGYQYPFGKVKPYFGAELTGGILLNPKSAFISTKTTNYGQALLYNPNKYDGEATETGIGIFAGVDLPISRYGIRIELKYHFGYMPSQSQIISYHQHALQLQVQFRISTSKASERNSTSILTN